MLKLLFALPVILVLAACGRSDFGSGALVGGAVGAVGGAIVGGALSRPNTVVYEPYYYEEPWNRGRWHRRGYW